MHLSVSYDYFYLTKLRIDRHCPNKLLLHFLCYQGVKWRAAPHLIIMWLVAWKRASGKFTYFLLEAHGAAVQIRRSAFLLGSLKLHTYKKKKNQPFSGKYMLSCFALLLNTSHPLRFVLRLNPRVVRHCFKAYLHIPVILEIWFHGTELPS